MLSLELPDAEYFDSVHSEFITVKGTKLALEHSLLSISRWESKYKKPFLTTKAKTFEETVFYIRCMSLKPIPDDKVLNITNKEIKQVNDYIDDPMTATWFSDKQSGRKSNEVPTSELIYYWMFANQIPKECEKWHLNRLLALIRIFSIKNQPAKKMSNRDILTSNASLNAARRAALGTKG